ncbi:hypothetical protein ACI8AC_24385 [Geodermatophilus sp. SYSU D00758]
MTRTRTALLRTTVPVAAVAAVLAAAGSAAASTVPFNAYDTDADGFADTYGFDDSGDGYEDTWAVDRDGDGVVEQVAVDTDLDGWADTFAFDSDEDGYVEEVGVDTTSNALPDVWGADTDLDGHVDAYAYDVDDDGWADHSEPAGSTYAAVTVVLAEAGDWAYWEVAVEIGHGLTAGGTADGGTGGLATLTGTPAAAAPAADGDLPGSVVAGLLGSLTGSA